MTPSTAYSRDLGDELRRLREAGARTRCRPSNTARRAPARSTWYRHSTGCGKDIELSENFKCRYQFAFDEHIAQLSEVLVQCRTDRQAILL